MTAAQQDRPEPPDEDQWSQRGAQTETPGEPLAEAADPAEEPDALLELRLQEYATFFLSDLSKEDLIAIIINDRRAWVQDRRRFLMWLAEHRCAVHEMPADEMGFNGDPGEPDEYCVEEIRELIGREPDEIDIRGYEAFLEFRYNEVASEAIVEWACSMPDR
jgi:hypothetical protein